VPPARVLQVTAMLLGRAARQRDKIFIAAGNTVRALGVGM
jgi:hypothetical protein